MSPGHLEFLLLVPFSHCCDKIDKSKLGCRAAAGRKLSHLAGGKQAGLPVAGLASPGVGEGEGEAAVQPRPSKAER